VTIIHSFDHMLMQAEVHYLHFISVTFPYSFASSRTPPPHTHTHTHTHTQKTCFYCCVTFHVRIFQWPFEVNLFENAVQCTPSLNWTIIIILISEYHISWYIIWPFRQFNLYSAKCFNTVSGHPQKIGMGLLELGMA